MDILEIIQAIPELKPLVKQTLDGLKAYKDEFKEIKDFVINESIDTQAKMFFGLVQKGFTRDEALAIVIKQSRDFANALKNANIKNSAGKAE